VGLLLAVAQPCCALKYEVKGTKFFVRLSVHPMPAPKPALRYQLLPELKELQPGNPVQNYMLCFMDQEYWSRPRELVRLDKFQSMPLKELPATDLLDYAGPILRQADRAARMDRPDWEVLPNLRTDGINMLLPDLQQLRHLTAILQVRFRAEIALGRFDDALRTNKTILALARHLGEHPTLIGNLVGTAIGAIGIGSLEEMLEQPGCPNLYWALTNLPTPLVSFERGIGGDGVMAEATLRDLDDSAPMSEGQLAKLIAHLDKVRGPYRKLEAEAREPRVRDLLDNRRKQHGEMVAARRRLVEHGIPEERVLRFPADQVFLLDEKREYEVRRDEAMKLMHLPSWQFEAALAKTDTSKKLPLLDFLRVDVKRIRRSQARAEQRIALLRHVEALRMYAAEHDGKLPEKLTDITVPLPVDPFTGRPFLYKVEGATAHVRGSPPPGDEKMPYHNVHFEVTMQAK
jgi:hypothetical protein